MFHRREVLIATTNQGKVREIIEILGDFDAKLLALADTGLNLEVQETGATYADPAAMTSADIGAFTDPPTAGEMATLRTQFNALRADVADIRTQLIALGADVGTALDGVAPHHKFYDDAVDVDALPYASTTDNETIFDLANALKDAYTAHIARVGGVHLAADATNTIGAADASDLATAYTLLNELKTEFNDHASQAGVHFMDDATYSITSPDASSAATAVTLANELKDDFVAHVRYTSDVYVDDAE